MYSTSHNALGPRHHGRHFADSIFKLIFLYENCCILIQISLKFVPKGQIYNKPALFQIIVWLETGNMPFSEQMKNMGKHDLH